MQLKNSILGPMLAVLFLLLFAGAPPEDHPDPVPLAKIVKELDLNYELDSTTGILKVQKDDSAAVFLVGSNEAHRPDGIVVNMKGKTTCEGGVLLVPPEGVDLIIRYVVKAPLKWWYEGDDFLTYKGVRPTGGASVPGGSVHERAGGYEVKTVIIDPGHGGKDPGGIGYKNIYEKDIVLAVSLQLERELKKRLHNVEIVITRTDDRFLSLEERSRIANSTDPVRNPIYVSVHANVSFTASTQGFESYFLSLEPYNEESREVASMENSVLGFETENYNDHLREILNRIVDIEYRRESMRLARFIQDGMKGSLGAKSQDRGVKSAFFYVLKAVKMPSVLIEIGFVTNAQEAERLVDSGYERTIAEGIAEGIVEFTEIFRKTEGFTR